MRSGIGWTLTILGLAMTIVLVLLLFGNLGMRSELEAVRGDVAALRAQAEAGDADDDRLVQRLDELDAAIDDLLLTTGGDGGGSGSDGANAEDVSDRLDEIIERLTALDDRIDEICGNVPVC